MKIFEEATKAGYNFAKMISISDFSKGKTSSIFEDVKKNNSEYVVLKNNQPAGVVLSYDSYQAMQNTIIDLRNKLLNKSINRRVIGGGKGKFPYPKDFDVWDKEIADMFLGV